MNQRSDSFDDGLRWTRMNPCDVIATVGVFKVSMDYQVLWKMFAEWVVAQPLLSATLFGVIFAGMHLLLMLTTRLGNVRRGLQSFVLSAVLHVLMVLSAAAVIPPTRLAKLPENSIQTVIVEERAVVINDQPVDLKPAIEKSELWNKRTDVPREEFSRQESHQADPEETGVPERTPTLDEGKMQELSLPDADRSSGGDQNPETAARSESKISVRPAENGVKFEEETAKAAPAAPRVGPQREQTGDRPRREMTRERHSTAESKPLPLVQEGGGVEADSPTTVEPTRAPEPKGGISDRIAEQKGELVGEDPGPGASVPDFPVAESPFRRSTPSGRNERGENSRGMEGEGGGSPGRRKASALEVSKGTSSGSEEKVFSPDEPGGPEGRSNPVAGSREIPSTYRMRDVTKRREKAISLGATPESEAAVERALVWLSKHQNEAGYWDADGFSEMCPEGDRCDRGEKQGGDSHESELRTNAFDPEALKNAGKHADTGLTGLVVLSFLGAGYTHEEGRYADCVDRALRWLVRQQQENGFMGGDAQRYDKMYCHGMATLALGEACGMTHDPANSKHLREALLKGVNYILEVQNPRDGGWRYLPGQRGDMSMFGWQLMALRSAEVAGIPIESETRERMLKFLRSTSAGQQGGLSAYMPGEVAKRSMTAESLFSRLILNASPGREATEEGVAYLLEELPRASRPDLYYWYYGTLALYHHGGDPWRKWNEALQDSLVTTQRRSGHAAGSWDPRDPWSLYGGRLYATTFSVLSLEVYYRFLPLYQAGGVGEGKSRK